MTVPYSTAIAEHFRRPRNYGPLPNATAYAEGVNPLCGDRVRVAILVDADGAIADARFTANACAICVASASLLTDRLRGMTGADVARLSESDVLAELGAEIAPGRRRCATLPLEAAQRAVASFAEHGRR